MSRAYSLIRDQPVYRADAFASGLKANGFEVVKAAPRGAGPGDVLLIWNRYFGNHDLACRFEEWGGTVLVAENAYIWKHGISPHHLKDRPAYALARSYHNDSTVIPDGGPERWGALGIELNPWQDGEHILVCPNRSFGVPGRIMPADWAESTCKRLRALTKREVRLRPHPGNDPPTKPLIEDLRGCHTVVIWSSSAGVHALVNGVRVVCCSPYWICKQAASEPRQTDEDWQRWLRVQYADASREQALRNLAHAQFSLQEIASGFAFASVLRAARKEEVPAGA